MTSFLDPSSVVTPNPDPFRFVLIAVSGWMNGRQSSLIDYLGEENRVLREQLCGKRLQFTDDQRRRLAARARHRPRHDRRHTGATWDRAGAGAGTEDHVEGVPRATLG